MTANQTQKDNPIILQGSNSPITITFEDELTGLKNIVASLWKGSKELKRWEKQDMAVGGFTAILPLEEDETKAFPKGYITLELKGIDTADQVVFWEDNVLTVIARTDKAIDLIEER